MNTSNYLRKFISGVIAPLAGMAISARAELLANYVPNGTITVDGSRADWSSVTPYTADGQDASGGVDFDTIWIANDDTTLYFRLTVFSGSPSFTTDGWRYNLFIDADQDRNTGFIGGSGQYSVGADYLIQGIYVFQFTGANQTTWGWTLLGTLSWDVQSGTDIELSMPMSTVGFVLGNQFNWIAWSDSNPEDFVPNAANQGIGGDFHSYQIVPEPGSVALLSLGALVAGAGRALRRAFRR